MIVEISGVGFLNMGAELMLVAARDELLSWDAVESVAISFRMGSRAQRRRAGCSAVLRLNSDHRPWANRAVELGSRIIPAAVLRAIDTVKPSAIGALVDASGFALGDQWGASPARRSARLYAQSAREGKPIVLLPQAFGPFEQAPVAEAARDALSHADLVYARDEESMVHLRGLKLTGPLLRIAPDFTNLVRPPIERRRRDTVVIIPNARMTDMTGAVDNSLYFEFLKACVAASRDAGYEVLIMGHEQADRRYGTRLAAAFDSGVVNYIMTDPVMTKALIGGCSLVISSRYHGIVNALSQEVPAVGTSWSHKYAQLFADYGCEDGLWPVEPWEPTYSRLAGWLSTAELEERSTALKVPAKSLRRAARAMWAEVSSVLS